MNTQNETLNRLKEIAAFLNGQGGTSEEETLRKELTDDLLLIISPTSLTEEINWTDPAPGMVRRSKKQIQKVAMSDYSESKRARESTRRDALELLLNKLKQLKLESWYTVADSSLLGEAKKRRATPRSVPKHMSMGIKPMETNLVFPDGQNITIKKFLNVYTDREYFFSILSEAINAGDSTKLRRCEECKTFFVATHLSKKYCAPKCQKTHDRNAAPLRAKEWRITHGRRQD